jgi:hypothetical protein
MYVCNLYCVITINIKIVNQVVEKYLHCKDKLAAENAPPSRPSGPVLSLTVNYGAAPSADDFFETKRYSSAHVKSGVLFHPAMELSKFLVDDLGVECACCDLDVVLAYCKTSYAKASPKFPVKHLRNFAAFKDRTPITKEQLQSLFDSAIIELVQVPAKGHDIRVFIYDRKLADAKAKPSSAPSPLKSIRVAFNPIAMDGSFFVPTGAPQSSGPFVTVFRIPDGVVELSSNHLETLYNFGENIRVKNLRCGVVSVTQSTFHVYRATNEGKISTLC